MSWVSERVSMGFYAEDQNTQVKTYMSLKVCLAAENRAQFFHMALCEQGCRPSCRGIREGLLGGLRSKNKLTMVEERRADKEDERMEVSHRTHRWGIESCLVGVMIAFITVRQFPVTMT